MEKCFNTEQSGSYYKWVKGQTCFELDFKSAKTPPPKKITHATKNTKQ
jgi:hypothetical protein